MLCVLSGLWVPDATTVVLDAQTGLFGAVCVCVCVCVSVNLSSLALPFSLSYELERSRLLSLYRARRKRWCPFAVCSCRLSAKVPAER